MNKKFLITIISAVFLVVSFAAVYTYSVFAQSLETPTNIVSYEDANKAQKPFSIFFSSPWCGACHQAQPTIYRVVNKYSKEYNFVPVNGQDRANYQLQAIFRVSGYPALFLVNPKNKEVKVVEYSNYFDYQALSSDFENFLQEGKK